MKLYIRLPKAKVYKQLLKVLLYILYLSGYHGKGKNSNRTNMINVNVSLLVTLLRQNYWANYHEALYT